MWVSELAREIEREQAVVDRALARLDVLRAEASQREREALAPGVSNPQGVYERDVQALAAAARRVSLDAAGEGLVNAGIHALDPAILDHIRPPFADFGHDVWPAESVEIGRAHV